MPGARNAGFRPATGPWGSRRPLKLFEISGSFRQNAAPKTSRVRFAKTRFVNFGIVVSPCIVEPCGSVAARRIPADCRAKLSVSNPSHSQKEGIGAPKFAGAERRARWPALRQGPSVSGRDCRSMTRTGAPFGAPLRRFP